MAAPKFAETHNLVAFSSTMASAIICLATNQKINFFKYIFNNIVKNLEGGVKFIMYPRFVQVFLDKQVEGMSKHKGIYVTPSLTKKVFANMKKPGKDFSGRVTPLFQTMIVQAPEEVGEGKGTEIPQSSGPIEPIPDDVANKDEPTHSNDALLSGEDRLKLNELMEIYTNLQKKVLDLETLKTAQAHEITSLKQRVKKLEKKKKSRTPGLKRLSKVGKSARVVSSKVEGLGDQEDASKQERKRADIDANVEVTLIDETHGRNDEDLMFDTGVLDEQEVEDEKTLIEIKAAKPKAITTTATITKTVVTRAKAKGVIVQEPSEFTTTTSPSQSSQLPQAKDKGKAKMVALNLQAQLEAELEEEERLARQKEEEANIALIKLWDNTQAMIEADFQMAQQLHAEEQEQLSIEEKSRLFVELLEKRKKHFAKIRAREKRNKPPTQAQQRKLYCNYLKNMEGYTLKQLKGFKFEVIKDVFDKAFKRVNTFIDYKIELMEESSKRDEAETKGSSKRAGEELESENLKKQKLDKNVESEVDDDPEEA
ncbi:hypothetical protein Tco_1447942 [Tanacetum coccineum]